MVRNCCVNCTVSSEVVPLVVSRPEKKSENDENWNLGEMTALMENSFTLRAIFSAPAVVSYAWGIFALVPVTTLSVCVWKATAENLCAE
eukprot:4679967-Amphidinium_carterae.1